jgi:folate-binding protein YgfZ
MALRHVNVLAMHCRPPLALVPPGDAYAIPSLEPLQGAIPMGETVWEEARITRGVPRLGHELTDNVLPLEAGLASAVSLSKGCYIGQETLAKVNNAHGTHL